MATTGVTPWIWMFSTCLRRLAAPASTSSGFSCSSSGGSGLPATTRYLPEWTLSARTVATITAASGARPDVRHLMLKNRSAPMSAPKPASVTTKSPQWMPSMSARPHDDIAQNPGADVQHSAPRDAVQVDRKLAQVVVDVVVDHRGQQVVGRGHGVEVAGQVEVEALHGHDLAVAATRGAAFDAERRAHRRLADGDDGALADVAERIAQADRRRRLAFAKRCRRNGRDDDVLRLRAVLQLIDRLELDLGDVVAVRLEQVRADAHSGRDVRHRLEPCPARDVQVAWKRGGGHGPLLLSMCGGGRASPDALPPSDRESTRL